MNNMGQPRAKSSFGPWRYSLLSLFAVLTFLCIGLAWVRNELDFFGRQQTLADAIENPPEIQLTLVERDHVLRRVFPARRFEAIDAVWFHGPPSSRASEVVKDDAFAPRLVSLYYSLLDGQITASELCIIAQIESVEELEIEARQIDWSGVIALGRMPRLKKLELNSPCLSDPQAAILARLPQIEELALGASSLSDKGLQSLAQMKSLRSLTLGVSKITPRGLDDFERRTSIRVVGREAPLVSLGGGFGGEGFVPMEDQVRLAVEECERGEGQLNLRGLEVTDQMLEPYAGRLSPTHIDGSFTYLSGRFLSWIRDPSAIESLDLSRSAFCDSCADGLRNCSGLKELDMSGTCVSPGVLSILSCERALIKLRLADLPIIAKDLEELRRFQEIQFLDLTGTQVDDKIFALLHELPKLQTANLAATNVSVAGAEMFRESHPHVDVISSH
ncbi:MAG TPA: hypothetical protein VMP01_01875 [Pirellulaceae bacterium]|nr:hypothetical protein [Pirellulaceae bacterium]